MTRTLLYTSIPLLLVGCATPSGSSVATDTPERQARAARSDTTPASTGTEPVAATPATPSVPAPVLFELAVDGMPEEYMWKCDPVFADVNRDGHLDMAAIPRLGDRPHVWFGDGRGSWTDASTGLDPEKTPCGGGLAFADINRDGHIDLAVADHCAGAFVYLGDGRGHWQMATSRLNPSDVVPDDPEVAMWVGAEDLDVGDVNGDGHLDLLVGGSDEGGINVYYGDGTGRGWQRQQGSLPQSGWANRVKLADVNDDGHLDAVAAFSAGPRVWLNDGAGDWRPSTEGLPSPVMHGLFHGLDVADVNEDGRLDVIVANWVDGPEVYLQRSDGSWSKTPDVFPGMLGGAIGLAVGDVDNDGHLDLAVSGRLEREGGYVRGVYLLLGDGNANWTHVTECGLHGTGLMGVAGVALGDVDGNGFLDVAVASGMNVESVPGVGNGPVVPQRVLVWRARPASGASSLAEVPAE